MHRNINTIYKDFPILVNHPDLVYLDSAATNQMPTPVIDSLTNFITMHNGSPHRGAHALSVSATLAYDNARKSVRDFIGAKSEKSCIFVRNSTEALNLIIYGFLNHYIKSEDKIVVSITAHHSAILPLQYIARSKNATLSYLYCDEYGDFPDSELDKIDKNTKFVMIPHISNGLGVIHNIPKLVQKSRSVGALFALDGAQSAGHMQIDVENLDVDFFVFSGHKIFAPQGIGVLYGKLELLEKFDPFLRGGDMIEYVEEQSATFAPLPELLEAGTQNVMAAVGLHAAIDYIQSIGQQSIAKHEHMLTQYTIERLNNLNGVSILGPKLGVQRGSLVIFMVDGVHPHDVATLLDEKNISIRAGHHCCQPLMKYMDKFATCRASFSVYNTTDDIDKLVEGILYVQEVFS